MSQVDGLSPERVMEIYYDMTGAGTAEDADYVYEVGSDGAESVHESDPPTDTAALGVSAPDMFPMNHPYAPSNQMAAAARDEGFSASDELGVEEMTAMILNVSTVLCCRQEDAALYLKKYNWSEIDAISGFLESGGDLAEATPPVSINAAVDFVEDENVRTPEAVVKRQLIKSSAPRIGFNRVMRSTNDHDRMEPGVEWLHNLPVDYPNCDQMLPRARQIALQSSKWLLVNIQSDKEFGCHVMNRDSWPDATVQAVIESGYIFWQRGTKSAAGTSFLSMYNICADAEVESHLFPALFFIDPRTGAVIKTIKGRGMITAIDLVTILFEFMEAHPTTSWDNLHEAPPPIPISKADEIRGATTDTAASIAAPPLVPIKANYGDVPEEPDASDPISCKISIKCRDGKSSVRRFRSTDSIKSLFAVVAEKESGEFEIRQLIPPMCLSHHLDRTIQDMSLAGCKLVVCPSK